MEGGLKARPEVLDAALLPLVPKAGDKADLKDKVHQLNVEAFGSRIAVSGKLTVERKK